MQIELLSEHNWTQEEAGLTNTVTQQISLQIQNLRLLATVGRARAGAQAAIRRFTHENWESFLDGIKKPIRLKFNWLHILIISAVILPLALIVTLVVVPAVFPAMAAETIDQYRFGANDESAEVILNTPGTPLAVPSPALVSAPRISLMFTGDINPGRCIARATLAARDFTYPFQFVAEKLRSADITIGSLDGTISDQSIPMPCPDSLNLIGPSRMVEGFLFAGFDVITVATNHAKNCGEKGWNCNNLAFQDTIQNLLSVGIQPVGGGDNLEDARAPVILIRQGVRFAFLGINEIDTRVWAAEDQPGTAPLSAATIESVKADIAAARAVADVVIVLPQWGFEYNPRPNAIQRVWAKEFMDAGATLIVGNHPHMIQPVEVFPNGVAFYALGNFVFDQPVRAHRESVVVEAIFNGSTLESWQLWPAYTNYYTFQTHWAEGPEGNKILDRAQTLWK
jgi:poly-gamma-glutamate synthesis protein (capsule biosynthesis protein)